MAAFARCVAAESLVANVFWHCCFSVFARCVFNSQALNGIGVSTNHGLEVCCLANVTFSTPRSISPNHPNLAAFRVRALATLRGEWALKPRQGALKGLVCTVDVCVPINGDNLVPPLFVTVCDKFSAFQCILVHLEPKLMVRQGARRCIFTHRAAEKMMIRIPPAPLFFR